MWQVLNGQLVDLPYPAGQASPYSAVQQTMPYSNYQTQMQPNYAANNVPKINTNIIRVYGIEGAKNYQLPPNSDIMLYDNDSDIVYRVTVDGTGKRNILTLDLSEHKEEPKPDFSQFATKADIEKLREEFVSIKESKNSINMEG